MTAAVSSQPKDNKPAFEVPITVDELQYNLDDVSLLIGDLKSGFTKDFQKQIQDIFSHIEEKCIIRAGFVVYPLYYDGVKKTRMLIGDVFFNMGKIVIRQIKQSEKAAVFACTIGSAMENWSRQIMRDGDPVQSYLIDAVASMITEKVVEKLHECIKEKMSLNNLKITNRYSPGYCDWPVSDQHQLFSLLPENFCGIRLNKSALMIPIKSVTGIIGIGQDVKFEKYICDHCSKSDCTYRTIKSKNIKI